MSLCFGNKWIKSDLVMNDKEIPGYTYRAGAVAKSPVSREDFDLLKKTVIFTEEDEKYLRLAGEILADQVEGILDLWYGFVGSHPHLVRYFSGQQGEPNGDYLVAVRKRFSQWILDTCNRSYDPMIKAG